MGKRYLDTFKDKKVVVIIDATRPNPEAKGKITISGILKSTGKDFIVIDCTSPEARRAFINTKHIIMICETEAPGPKDDSV